MPITKKKTTQNEMRQAREKAMKKAKKTIPKILKDKPVKNLAKTESKKVGRPTAIDANILAKLRDAFSYAATDEEACQQANISPATLYRYIEENPEFWEEKERLKNMPNFTAKKVIISQIQEWDEKSAQWWLERKAKNEFSTRSEITGKDGENITAVNFNLIPITKNE